MHPALQGWIDCLATQPAAPAAGRASRIRRGVTSRSLVLRLVTRVLVDSFPRRPPPSVAPDWRGWCAGAAAGHSADSRRDTTRAALPAGSPHQVQPSREADGRPAMPLQAPLVTLRPRHRQSSPPRPLTSCERRGHELDADGAARHRRSGRRPRRRARSGGRQGNARASDRHPQLVGLSAGPQPSLPLAHRPQAWQRGRSTRGSADPPQPQAYGLDG